MLFSPFAPIIAVHHEQQQQHEHDDVSSSNSSAVTLIRFYQWNFIATLMWWILIQFFMKKNICQATYGSVVTCPSWMSRVILHRLQSSRNRSIIFSLYLLTLLLAAMTFPIITTTTTSQSSSSSWPWHCQLLCIAAVASIVSLYHLVESSVTHRHGEYPLLYSAWAMCLFDDDYVSAACWGIVIHFVLSTGMAKLYIGGIKWMTSPETMKFYLSVYRNSKTKSSQPWLFSLNYWICQRPWATVFISTVTILVECFIIPMTLLLPAINNNNPRFLVGCLVMIGMHVGIYCIMSKQVGIVFFTTLPTYIIGFHCSAARWTGPWWVAVTIGLGPTLLGWIIRFVASGSGSMLLLPEDWPFSPISLFMFSGHQAQILSETLMTRNTRVVLGTSDKTATSIVGLPVLHHGAVAPPLALSTKLATTTTTAIADEAVHDCVLRVIGFTILQGDLITAIPKPAGQQQRQRQGDEWNVGAFVKQMQIFLVSKKRLFETQSGQLLTKAFFVQIDDKGNVAKVLFAADQEEVMRMQN